MSETIIIIILAVILHYALENINNIGDYSCPSYCGVDHEHIYNKKEKVDVWIFINKSNR